MQVQLYNGAVARGQEGEELIGMRRFPGTFGMTDEMQPRQEEPRGVGGPARAKGDKAKRQAKKAARKRQRGRG